MENDTTIQVKFGKAVRHLRKERGLTQIELCKLTGLDLKYLSNIENGHKNVSIGVVERLSKAFGVNVSSIFKLAGAIE